MSTGRATSAATRLEASLGTTCFVLCYRPGESTSLAAYRPTILSNTQIPHPPTLLNSLASARSQIPPQP